MGSDGIVQPPPLLDEYRCLGQCVEDLSVQELVSQFAVEALVVAVLPRTARRDVEGLEGEIGWRAVGIGKGGPPWEELF